MAASLGLYFTRGLNYGVDFKGGSLIEVQSKNGAADLHDIRTKLNALGIGNVQIQSFGADTDVLIRVEQQPGGEGAQQAAMKKVVEALGDGFTQRRIEVVGPAVSSELRRTGIIAVLASIIAIIVYVWFRFEWQFAAGCVVALLHDVLVTVGIVLAVAARFRSVDRRGAADHPRLLGERHRRRVRPHPRELAQVQEDGSQRAAQHLDQRDAVAHDPDRHDGDRGHPGAATSSAAR